MPSTRFVPPVPIFVGLGFPVNVETAERAFEVLCEWSGARGPTYTMAMGKVRHALTNKDATADARLAFEAFARKALILDCFCSSVVPNAEPAFFASKPEQGS